MAATAKDTLTFLFITVHSSIQPSLPLGSLSPISQIFFTLTSSAFVTAMAVHVALYLEKLRYPPNSVLIKSAMRSYSAIAIFRVLNQTLVHFPLQCGSFREA